MPKIIAKNTVAAPAALGQTALQQPAGIDQDTINAAVWNACLSFRGAVDPIIWRDLVLAMLFLKYISDVWQDTCDQYKKDHGEHPELIAELLRNERFVLPESSGFHTLHEARHLPGNGERIDKALRDIEESNIARLRDVFQDISFNTNKLGDEAEKNDILRRLLEDFAKPELNLRPSHAGAPDVTGNACEFLIMNVASSGGKKAGDFYTPPEVSQLMAQLMDPQEGDSICDPACGSASLLIKCGQSIRRRNGSKNYALFGQEAMSSTRALARMNMFLHGEDNHIIESGDTLRNPRLLDNEGRLRQFDIVVADLPFSLEKWGYDVARNDMHRRFLRGLPPRTKGDYGFILHMIETMAPGSGRMAVVVPHGVLFRGAAEGRIRKQLIDENLLDVVIGLPEKLFYGAGIPAAILVFRKQKADDKVLFIDARRDYLDGKNRNVLRREDLDKIIAACAARRSVDNYARLATPAEIADNGYNLNIPRYVDTFAEKDETDLATLRAEREKLKAELAVLERRMSGYLNESGGE